MTKEDLLDIHTRASQAYARMVSLSEDPNQPTLVNRLARDSRNDMSAVVMKLANEIRNRFK